MPNADRLVSQLAQSVGWPVSRDARFVVLAVTFWPAEISPVVSRRSSRGGGCFTGRWGDTCRWTPARTPDCCRGCGLLRCFLVAILLELSVMSVVRAFATRCAED